MSELEKLGMPSPYQEIKELRQAVKDLYKTLEMYAASDLYDAVHGQRLTESTARLVHELGAPARLMIGLHEQLFKEICEGDK